MDFKAQVQRTNQSLFWVWLLTPCSEYQICTALKIKNHDSQLNVSMDRFDLTWFVLSGSASSLMQLFFNTIMPFAKISMYKIFSSVHCECIFRFYCISLVIYMHEEVLKQVRCQNDQELHDLLLSVSNKCWCLELPLQFSPRPTGLYTTHWIMGAEFFLSQLAWFVLSDSKQHSIFQ